MGVDLDDAILVRSFALCKTNLLEYLRVVEYIFLSCFLFIFLSLIMHELYLVLVFEMTYLYLSVLANLMGMG